MKRECPTITIRSLLKVIQPESETENIKNVSYKKEKKNAIWSRFNKLMLYIIYLGQNITPFIESFELLPERI